jgi:excisionase family DNA binding protein
MQNTAKPKLLSRAEAAERLGKKVTTLEMWAHTGRPPLPYLKIGGSVRYREDDIENFLESRIATSATAHKDRKPGLMV